MEQPEVGPTPGPLELQDPDPVYPRRRRLNIYDAVAGLVSSKQSTHTTTQRLLTPSAPSRASILSPAEALLRSVTAPALFAEYDLYDAASRLLPDGGTRTLPAGELLEGIHGYASYFYEGLATKKGGRKRTGLTVGGRLIDERSCDETALIALGVLLEEAGREVLGRRGDLVFTEGREKERERQRKKKRKKTGEVDGDGGKKGRIDEEEVVVGAVAEELWKPRETQERTGKTEGGRSSRSKRRRIS